MRFLTSSRTFLTKCRLWPIYLQKSNLHVNLVLENSVKSKYEDAPMSRLPYFEFVWSNKDKYGDKIALADAVSGYALNYSESYQQSKNFGWSLKTLGAKKGEVLALLVPNCVEYPIVLSGSSLAGVSVTTMNPLYTATEIARQMKMSKSTWAVTTAELLPIVNAALHSLVKEGSCKMDDWLNKIMIVGGKKSPPRILIEAQMTSINFEKYQSRNNDPVKGYLSVNDLVANKAPDDLASDIDVDEDIFVLPYSSGTTGLPKGVMLSHFNVVANICQGIFCPNEVKFVPPAIDSYQPVTLCILPMFHIYAMNVTTGPTLYSGGKMVFLPKFEPKSFIKALEDHRPTFLNVAPPLLSFLTNSSDVTPKHLESLEFVVVGAAPTGPALASLFKKKAPNVILREGWGMSELSPMALITPMDDVVEGSCGVVLPNTTIKIVDVATGQSVGPNQTGELCVKGPQVMKGYLDNPQATAETIREDWLHSGDIGYYDDKGHLYIVDRLKELIKVKGFQVAPAELEDLLRTMPGVADVGVVGVPHERFGEAPRAYVVPKADSSLTEASVAKFVEVNAAPYKQLVGGVKFLDAIPKSPSGKILRRILRDLV